MSRANWNRLRRITDKEVPSVDVRKDVSGYYNPNPCSILSVLLWPIFIPGRNFCHVDDPLYEMFCPCFALAVVKDHC